MRTELQLRRLHRRTTSAAVAAILAVAWIAGACSDDAIVDPPVAAVATDAAASAMAMAQASDRDILVALYHATDGPNWRDNTNWLTDEPLGEWYGVDTDAEGRVNRLILRGQQEDGEYVSLGLAGEIPPELRGLTKLVELRIEGNRNLRGSIPPELGDLVNLKYLSLGWNYITGPIPPELGKLGNLEVLQLYGNDLTDSIPAELGSLANLTHMNLGESRLTGSIPRELGGLAKLTSLYLGLNRLSGEIPPELSRLANLERLYLFNNALSGAIPPELGNLAKLTDLGLGDNELTGPVPLSFQQLTGLRSFSFDENSGLCIPDPLVAWYEALPRQRGQVCPDREVLLALYETAGGDGWTNSTGWLGDGLLAGWHGVKTDSSGLVSTVDLSGNGLSGGLTGRLGDLAGLTTLRVGDNDLTGRLPSSLRQTPLRELQYANTDLCAPAERWVQEWLAALARHEGTGVQCPPLSDRELLTALYEATDGPNWRDNTNWLTDKPLGEWYGVDTDADGRVWSLLLHENELAGLIPPELGDLTNLNHLYLYTNALSGAIPPELAGLGDLKRLILYSNELSGPIPPELDRLANLELLYLDSNELSGPIPPELGRLANLELLYLDSNELSGPIPPELGRLASLERLYLYSNELSGPIPPELGRLASLERLYLDSNELSGPIPPELGRLASLERLYLYSNELSGPIPPELGRLANLERLYLDRNELSGPIPPELGRLANLERLYLYSNELTSVPPELRHLGKLESLALDENRLASVPPELSALGSLRWLWLNGNQLTDVPLPPRGFPSLELLDLSGNELRGSLPAGLLELTGLVRLYLADNSGLVGPLPRGVTSLEHLEDFHTIGTGLCAPGDPEFLDWLESVTRQRMALCDRSGGPAAYLIQAVQSREFPVPLVADEPALLRAFVTVDEGAFARMPPVRATFYQYGAVTHVADIPGTSIRIPSSVDESSLSNSANAEIPGSVIQPGLEVVIEPDPDGTLDPALGVARRIPATGRMALDVRAMPVFEVTLVPFIWQDSPNYSIVDTVAGMAADPAGHELFEHTHLLLPVSEIDATAHPPVATSTNNGFDLLREVEMIRIAEGGRGHYLALMAEPTRGNIGGVAYGIGSWSSFSVLNSEVFAHEFGHNRGLLHAPCGGAGGPDRGYPYEKGNIGAWGYDFSTGDLVRPGRWDFMSYCDPTWTSDYQFTNAVRYRLETETNSVLIAADADRTAAGHTLMLWGGQNGEGAPNLRPSFYIDAPAALPQADGPWSLTGTDAQGTVLFSFSFAMAEFTDTDDDRAGFSFAVPVTWTVELAEITLQGPGGSASLNRDTDRPLTILRDPATRRIRGILEGPPAQAAPGSAAAAAGRAPQDLQVIFSRGIPGSRDLGR